MSNQTHAQAGGAPQTPPPRPYFDVAELINVHEHKKWRMGAAFLRCWLDGDACVAWLDPHIHKSTIGANLTNNCVRIYTLEWDQLLTGTEDGFVKARRGLEQVQDLSVLFNEAAQSAISKTYGNKPGKFGEWLRDNLSPNDFFPKIGDHQLQHSKIIEATGLDDVGASLANFYYYVFYKGETIPSEQFRSRLNDLRRSPSTVRRLKDMRISIDPPIPNDKISAARLEENLKKLEKFKAVIIVEAVGIYLGDIFEFNGKQYLGTWNPTKLDVKASIWDGVGYSEPGPVAPDKDGWIVVGNETFRNYRDVTGKGGDFLVFTPVKLVKVDLPGKGGEPAILVK